MSTRSGKSRRSLLSFCLSTTTNWMSIKRSFVGWLIGLSVRTLIGNRSIVAWLNMPLRVHERKEAMMRIRVQVIIEAYQETTPPHIEEVACFERGALTEDSLGLRLDEAQQMLSGVQQVMTTQQVEHYVEEQRQCSHCQKPLACKGHHQISLRTLFGKLTLD